MHVLIINAYISICTGKGRRKCSSVRGGVPLPMGQNHSRGDAQCCQKVQVRTVRVLIVQSNFRQIIELPGIHNIEEFSQKVEKNTIVICKYIHGYVN